jgi:hypothetical protein
VAEYRRFWEQRLDRLEQYLASQQARAKRPAKRKAHVRKGK